MIKFLSNIFKAIIWPIIFIIGQILIIFVVSLPFRIKNSSLINFNELLNNYISDKAFFISIITFIIFLPIFVKQYKKYRKNYNNKIQKKNIVFYILLGGAINLFFNIIVFNFNQIFSFTNIYSEYNTNVLISLIVTGILGPILEEFLFRGICYNGFKKAFGLNMSMLLSSLLFSLFHNNIINSIYAFIIGIFLVKYYENYRNLKIPIYIHIGSNLLSILFYNTIISDNIIVNLLIFLTSLIIIIYSIINFNIQISDKKYKNKKN